MILSNSRIKKENKITFYEQDVLLDDHIYTGDIEVTLNVDYVNSGTGIALISNEGLSLAESNELYLFKIGYSNYEIIHNHNGVSEIIKTGSALNIKPYTEKLNLKLKVVNDKAYFYINESALFQGYIIINLDSYILGYYNNTGNSINSIAISSNVPEDWSINMNNTCGGYIDFDTNKFSISGCSDIAEVEQIKIPLEKNKENEYYYLKYDKENIDGNNDIVAYVFLSDDENDTDSAKNILSKSNKFHLTKDCAVNIKFVGTVGVIKNIQIADNQNDFFVETEYEPKILAESSMKINTSELSKIDWTGTIFNTPYYSYDSESNEEFGFVRDAVIIYYPSNHNVLLNKKYYYSIDLSNNILTIKDDDQEIAILNLTIKDSITIFENVDAMIYSMCLYEKDGTTINPLIENTTKEYVPASIKSPIIVTDNFQNPLDLSSSYRIIENNGKIKYLFTNKEREIFDSSNQIRLTNVPLKSFDSVIIYGVLKDSKTYEDKILYSDEDELNGIDLYCDAYDTFNEADLFSIDKTTGVIVISNKTDTYIKNKYKEFVVDYLKKDSYSINYRHELGCYEVDISSLSDTEIHYDGAEIVNGLSDIAQYKILDIDCKNDSYIVLKERS
jgi:hypothetical protein